MAQVSAVGPDIFLFIGAKLTFTGSSQQTIGAIDSDTNAPSGSYDGGVTVNMNSSTNVTTYNGATYTYRGGTTINTGTLSTSVLPTTGSVSIASNGGLYFTLSSTYAPTVAITNAGALDISGAAFTISSSFTNTSNGNIYLVGNGSLSSASQAISTGNSLNIGLDSLGVFSADHFTVQSNIAVTSINVYKNSAISTNSATASGNLYLIGPNATFSA